MSDPHNYQGGGYWNGRPSPTKGVEILTTLAIVVAVVGYITWRIFR